MRRILLVDDTTINRFVLKRMLEILNKDYIIDEASNGKEAIEAHKQLVYDIIFMDVVMPILDGLQATKTIRMFDSRVFIIGLTGQVERTGEFLKEGMNRVMSKPLSLKELKRLMESLSDNL